MFSRCKTFDPDMNLSVTWQYPIYSLIHRHIIYFLIFRTINDYTCNRIHIFTLSISSFKNDISIISVKWCFNFVHCRRFCSLIICSGILIVLYHKVLISFCADNDFVVFIRFRIALRTAEYPGFCIGLAVDCHRLNR